MTNKNYALKISFVYLIFGILWIFLSDAFLGLLPLNKAAVTSLSVIKGWLFVSLSAFLIYLISNRYLQKLAQANQLQQESYAELTATYEKLTEAEEELRHQFDEILHSSEKINLQNVVLSTVQETATGLINELNVDSLLYKIIQTATELANTSHGFILLLDKAEKEFCIKTGIGLFEDLSGVFKIDQNSGLVGQVLRTGQLSVITNYAEWEHRVHSPQLSQVKSIIQVPLIIKQEVIGTIGLVYTEPGQHFDENHINLLERIAAMASISLNNAYLHTQLKTELEQLEQKEETIRAIFDATHDAIIVQKAESAELISCNRKAEELFGFTREEVEQIEMKQIPISFPGNNLLDVIKNPSIEGSQLSEIVLTNARGEQIFLETNQRRVAINGLSCILSVIRDISERKKQDAELALIQAQKLAILQAIPDLIFRIDINGVFLDFNQPANFDLFLPPEQFLGKNLVNLFPTELAHTALGQIKRSILNGETELLEYQSSLENKVQFFEARFVKSGDFEALAIIRDITYRKQMEQKLEFLSLHDSLTEVFNRTYFEEQILKIRNQTNTSTGIIVCDVDGLKLINDTIGHHAGDKLLKVTAQILKSCASPSDVIARIGGDEFAVIVSRPEQQKMKDLSAAIKTSVKNYNTSTPQLPLSLSTGWAISFDNVDINALFKEADNNMYREKMHQGLSTHNAVVQAMMQALEARDFITEGHADRLESLVEHFAQKLQLPAPLIADLKLLAKFHDIGKVGIPDNILFKPGRLTQEEFSVMRRHCDIGFRIAKSTPDLAPIAEWILKHQEWWNGQGYPLGLAGEDIPLACRILTIADAFDAMTNDRPYRKAMDYQEAIMELRRCAGTQFDPLLTKSFIEMLTNQSN